MPEQPFEIPGARSPYLYQLSGKGYTTRLEEDHAQLPHDESSKSARTEALIMREVAFWQQSQTCDDFWTPRAPQHRQVGYTDWQINLST